MLSFFPYFLLYRKNAPAAINPRTAAPPTSPPTIAPVLLEDLLLLDVDCVGAAVPEVVEEDEVVELAEDEEEGEEEDEDDFEAAEAAELARAARATDLKGAVELWPLNVVKAVCHVDATSELQKYCSTVAPGTAYRMLPQYGAVVSVH